MEKTVFAQHFYFSIKIISEKAKTKNEQLTTIVKSLLNYFLLLLFCFSFKFLFGFRFTRICMHMRVL